MTSSPVARFARFFAIIAAGLAASGIGSAQAFAASAMTTGGLTSQPIGHYEFCKANPAECAIRPADLAPVRLTSAIWPRRA